MPKKNPHKGIFAPDSLKNAKIQADPRGQQATDFRKNHPYLAAGADILSPAWDVNNNVGVTDILGAIPADKIGTAVAFGGGKNLPRLREMAIEQLENVDFKNLPEWTSDFITYMQSKYPRIMAHQPAINPMDKVSEILGTLGSNWGPKGEKISNLEFSKAANPQTAFHETQHSLQRINDPELTTKYLEEQQAVGYGKNKYEIDANTKAPQYTSKFENWRDKYNPVVAKLDPNLLDPNYHRLQFGTGGEYSPQRIFRLDKGEPPKVWNFYNDPNYHDEYYKAMDTIYPEPVFTKERPFKPPVLKGVK